MKDQPTEEGQTLEGHKLLWGIWVVSLPLAAILVLFSKDVFTETFGEPFKIWLGMGTLGAFFAVGEKLFNKSK